MKFRLLIMCLLGLFEVFFEISGTQGTPTDALQTEMMMSMTNEAEEMTVKSKRHHLQHPVGTPCPQQVSYSHSGTYLPPVGLSAYKKPVETPSYYQHGITKVESIGYEKPVIPKIIYQTIQKPAAIHHHAAYNNQPNVHPQVQYIHQPTYVPTVKEHEISYHAKPAPAVSYENVQKLFTNYVKPVQHIQPLQMLHHIKAYAKDIPCENHHPAVVEKPIEKPVMEMHSYHAKQFFQPISYYPKTTWNEPKNPISIFTPNANNKFHYPTTDVMYQKSNLVSEHQSIIKIAPMTAEPACEKIHDSKISYVKIPQKILQNLHQPMFQYAPKYHQPAVVQEPMVHYIPKIHQPPVVQQPQLFHFAPKIHQPAIPVHQPLVHISPKIHQPIEQNTVIHYPQPNVYANTQHSVSTGIQPQPNYHVHNNYHSPIQPCYQ